MFAYPAYITYGINFSYTTGTFASKMLLKSYVKIEMVSLHVTCDKKNFGIPWFVVVYDICPTHCVFSIPLPKAQG